MGSLVAYECAERAAQQGMLGSRTTTVGAKSTVHPPNLAALFRAAAAMYGSYTPQARSKTGLSFARRAC